MKTLMQQIAYWFFGYFTKLTPVLVPVIVEKK